MKGTIFDIQHFSVHDGPGIRTTVFLKGCQLRCIWCHNPEGILTRPRELSFAAGNCIGCGKCFGACVNKVHVIKEIQATNKEHCLERGKCTYCGACANSCPTKALSLCGREAEAADVIEEALRDKAFYRENGGITISGGEPLLQRGFTEELAGLSKQAGLRTAMETNLCYPYEHLNSIKENIDLFLADWKETDSDKHKEFTGLGNEAVLENISRLHDEGFNVLLRCPIIPGYNDREDHFKKIADITISMPGLLGAEILPYHSLGVSKNERFGLSGEIKIIALKQPNTETVERWIKYTRDLGGRLVNE